MTQTTEILCDACGADLTYTSNAMDYMLTLASFAKAHRPTGGFSMVTDMIIYPPINATKHFCGINCLKEWVNR